MKEKLSKKSILPHWSGETYTKVAAPFYDSVTQLTGWKRQLSRHALDGLEKGSLLDVGCGTGEFLSMAHAKGFQVSGVDLSEGMLKRLELNHPQLTGLTQQASVEKLPFADESFDIVFSSGVLVHVPEIIAAAKEITRVLKPGGVLRIFDHAKPKKLFWSTPISFIFSEFSGDILHDYEKIFSEYMTLSQHQSLGRGGYLQKFDFRKASLQ